MNSTIGNGGTNNDTRSIGDHPTMPGAVREIRIGMKIGPDNRYLIKDILGKGGMGEVYLAFDEISKTEVAIKLVPREISTSEDEMEQVRKNFALVRNLHHPNIAAVTALERLASGEYILVMEAVQGRKTLQKERLSRENERIPIAEAIQICRQIAEALDHAHEQGVIHRDIKPGNIMLTPGGKVKLTDFGLAAQIVSSLSKVSVLPTKTSGTRPYMAPEQWEGRLQDARTDQWSLAILFYELVTGRLPFPATDMAMLERQILERMPEKPDTLSPTQWSALKRALSKDKEGRFPTCTAFLDALEGKANQGAKGRFGALTVAAILLAVVALVWIAKQKHGGLSNEMPSDSPSVSSGISETVLPSDMPASQAPEYRDPAPEKLIPIPEENIEQPKTEQADVALELAVVGGNRIFRDGETLEFSVRSDTDGYLALMVHQSDSNTVVLFPNRHSPGSRIRGSIEMRIPGTDDRRFEIVVGPPYGTDTVEAVFCTNRSALHRMLEENARESKTSYRVLARGLFVREHEKSVADLPDAVGVRWGRAIITVQTLE